jgi:putative ABC transport system permease protein
MTGLIQDVRYALRRLRKSPGFALFSILVMALGIGATTAMFSVVHAVLLKPLPYPAPGRIVLLTKGVTPVRFDEMHAASRSYDELGAFAGALEPMTLSERGATEVLSGARVSANFLKVLGVSPLIGRSFLSEEDKAGAPAVAMISEKLWQQRFGEDPRIAGKTIFLAGAPNTIIGVLSAGFQFPRPGLDVWVTKPSELSAISTQSRPISPTLRVFGRLKPNVTIQEANAELAVLRRQYAADHPGMMDAKPNSPETLLPLKDEIISDIRPKLWMLFGAVGLVLLIVCANIGSLVLVRAISRTREFAVRTAIGAGRGRIMRQLVAESMVLAAVGGTLALGLAALGLSLIRSATFIDLPRAGEIHVDGVVLAFAVAVATVTGLLFGLAPSLVASKSNLASVLRGSGERVGASASKPWKSSAATLRFGPRGFLVIGQMALSITLLIGATLLIQSLARLYRVDPGFQSENLLTMHIALSPARYDTAAKMEVFYQQLVDNVKSLPGVSNAAVTLTLPMTGWMGMPVQLAAAPVMKLNERPISVVQLTSPEYFQTMKIALKKGREFTAHDSVQPLPVAIINESLARRFWPQYPLGPDPIGRYLLVGANHPPRQIVGIVADVREKGKDHAAPLALYFPNVPDRSVALVVRTDGDPLLFAGAVQKQVLAIDPGQAVSNVRTMNDVVESSEGQLRLMMKLLAAFAAVATLLAMIGLYGVVSYSVAQRTKEIGIRSALGARRSDILTLVVGQGLSLSLAGVVVGLCAAFGLTRVLRELLFQVAATDPATFVGISIFFVFVALLASYIPARRAANVDPIVTLRYE